MQQTKFQKDISRLDIEYRGGTITLFQYKILNITYWVGITVSYIMYLFQNNLKHKTIYSQFLENYKRATIIFV